MASESALSDHSKQSVEEFDHRCPQFSFPGLGVDLKMGVYFLLPLGGASLQAVTTLASIRFSISNHNSPLRL